MKYYIIMVITGLFFLNRTINGQNTMSTPINIGYKSSSFTYTDTQNTEKSTNDFIDQDANDIFYKFTLTRSMVLIISHCGSEINDTYVHLLDETGITIAENDDESVAGCSNRSHSYLKIDLDVGTYYVVSEGYDVENGIITTTIQGNENLDPIIDKNFILTITPTVATSDASSLTTDQSLQDLQYFDGLGRPLITVQKNYTPKKEDFVSIIEYDGAGRKYKQWLPIPIPNNQGAYVSLEDFSNTAFKIYNNNQPYNEKTYENSPLNRIIFNKGPGSEWGNHPKGLSYETNGSEVTHYLINSSNHLQIDANYATGTLYKAISTDEDGKTITEYKNKIGQVVMNRSEEGGHVDTYYVYNDFGQLCYVLPPIAADSLPNSGVIDDDNGVLKRYAYLYKYDERGNNIMKRLPGCRAIYMVYDRADRLVLSQDGNQRKRLQGATAQWTVTKYDVFGRVVFTGLMYRSEMDSVENYKSIRDVLSNVVVTNTYAGFATATPLTINYYDNYNFTALQTNGSKLDYITPPDGYGTKHTSANGLLTGSRTYILDKTGTNYLNSAVYYDDRGQVVQTRSTNHLGGYDIAYNQYNFNGSVKQTRKEHNIVNQAVIPEIYTYTYDHAGRLLTTLYELNNNTPVLLVDNSAPDAYDELGRLRSKKRHNGTDTEQFDYNIRNWTTWIKSGGFEENLYYNNVKGDYGASPLYNGNISYSTWLYNGSLKWYSYDYDNLNRLNISTYEDLDAGIDRSEGFRYDKQGNITHLERYLDGEPMDMLTLTHTGNQLKKITDADENQGLYNVKEYIDGQDAITEFFYDKNGNMTTDLDRNIITIRYNILNLPDTIQFGTGNQIINKYAANGQKLSTEYYTKILPLIQPLKNGEVYNWKANPSEMEKTSTLYIGNFEYETSRYDWNTPVLNRISNNEGYVDNLNVPMQNVRYNYYRRDHLGNNREVWYASYNKWERNADQMGYHTVSIPAATSQQTQYYPSGLPWAEGMGQDVQTRKYNGKEFVEMHGYDSYDYGWRGYNPSFGRFTTIDRLAEMYYSLSPYAYCKNNPINYIDPNGEFSTWAQAWLNRLFNGGGNEIQKNSNNQYYYTKGALSKGGASKGGVTVSYVYGSNGVKGKPDQNAGIPFVVNGGVGGGFGSDTRAKYIENPVNITPFMFPFGGTITASKAQFAYDLANKIAALVTANVSSSSQGINSPNPTGEEDDLALYETTYSTVWGDDEGGKNVGGYQRHRGDTTHRVLHYFNKKGKSIIKREIYVPTRYKRQR